MITKYIDVEGYWGVVLCYDLDWDDEDRIRAYLRSFGVKEERIDYCVNTVLGRVNCACCVSSYDTTMSLVLIGPTTSKEQMVDSLAHELDHVQDALSIFYGFQLGSEDAAYTMGFLMREGMKAIMPACMRG
ncbi:MAG: hypothetical protein J5732_00650 [Bacteroidaceae bacterium]|nr:hypothetical protein [Bacteroidaceae bacterium]